MGLQGREGLDMDNLYRSSDEKAIAGVGVRRPVGGSFDNDLP